MRMARCAAALLILSCLLLLPGCWVYSVYPLAESDTDLLFDKALLGAWVQEEEGCAVTVSRLGDESCYRLSYAAPKERKGGGCLLDPGKSATFQAGLVEIGSTRFLDVFPADRNVEHHVLHVHSFYKVKLDARALTLTPMHLDWLQEQMRSDALPLAARQENDDLILTGSTKELRSFLQVNSRNEDLFDPAGRLVFLRKVQP